MLLRLLAFALVLLAGMVIHAKFGPAIAAKLSALKALFTKKPSA